MLHYLSTPVTHFAQNCSLLWCDVTMQAALVDPGGEAPRLLELARQQGVQVVKLLLTHGHIDHVGAAPELAAQLKVPIEGPHAADAFWLAQLPMQASMFGAPLTPAFTPDRWLDDGDTVTLGQETLHVRHCPGHTPGHVVFHHAASQHAWVGDVLFRGSIGRTDFPMGDLDTLLHSITTRLWPMGNDTEFIPGHGPNSTFGQERRSNPFVADAQLKRV